MEPLRFNGKSSHKLDAKGRFAVPARFKGVMDLHGLEGFYITTMVVDNHLGAYPGDVWNALQEKMLSYPKKNEFLRLFASEFIGNVQFCTVDTQGRLLIPPQLRESVGIEKDVVLIGSIDHVLVLSEEQAASNARRLREALQKEENREILADIF